MSHETKRRMPDEMLAHDHAEITLRARRERARWIGELAGAATGWLKGHLPVAMLARRQRRRELGELLALDDHTLTDIGLRRDELRAVVHGKTTLDELNAARSRPRDPVVVPFWRRRREAPASADLGKAA